MLQIGYIPTETSNSATNDQISAIDPEIRNKIRLTHTIWTPTDAQRNKTLGLVDLNKIKQT